MPLELATILIFLLVILIFFYVKFTYLPNQKTKPKKKNKYYNPKNNYFRNSPEHVDMTKGYIDNVWDELKK